MHIKHCYCILWIIHWVALWLFTGCSPKEKTENDKILIVTTTGMIKDAVENVVGNHATTIALMGPAVDPHLYKASHGDLDKLSNAHVIFYNGLHLEGKMGEVLNKLSHRKTVIAISDQIPEDKLRTVPGFAGNHDPHIWFDVALWKNAVQAIQKTMTEVDPAHAEEYIRNSQNYQQQLDSLHLAVQQEIKKIPQSQRVLITAHDAFGYFGDAYAVEVRGLQGISTVTEFGLKDRIDLTDFIISKKIKAIFIETSVNSRSIEAIVESCQQKGWPVTLGGKLYSDAMGAAGTQEGTYIGMIHANVQTIVNALQ